MKLNTLKPAIPMLDQSRACKPVERDRSRAARKEREQVLIRDLYTCQICGIRRADEVDHIVPLHRGGSDDAGNKQSICSECHTTKSERERWKRER